MILLHEIELTKFASRSFFLSGLTAEIDDCLKTAAISEIKFVQYFSNIGQELMADNLTQKELLGDQGADISWLLS